MQHLDSIFLRKQAERDRMVDDEEETSIMEDIVEEEDDIMDQVKPRPVFQSFPQAVGKINIKTVAQIDPRFAASEDPHDDESDSGLATNSIFFCFLFVKTH